MSPALAVLLSMLTPDTLTFRPAVSLRARMAGEAARRGLGFVVPPPELCADNAAMVAGLGYLRLARGEDDGLDLDATGGLERPERG